MNENQIESKVRDILEKIKPFLNKLNGSRKNNSNVLKISIIVLIILFFYINNRF